MRSVLAGHLPSTTLVWLASDRPALPSTPEEPTDDPHRRDVPETVPDYQRRYGCTRLDAGMFSWQLASSATTEANFLISERVAASPGFD
jgi:hypothetical protein